MTATDRGEREYPLSRAVAGMPRVGSRLTDELLDRMRAAGQPIIPVSAYPWRPLPDEVMEEVLRACRHTGHAPARGLVDLRELLAQSLAAETGVRPDPEREVFVTQGAMHALNLVFTAILEPGDEVLTFSPCYFFHGIVELRGARMVHVPLAEEHGFAFDMDRLEAAVTPRTRAILVNTPANPTGYVATREDMEALAALAERRGLLLVSDESYDRLVYDGRTHWSALRSFLPGKRVALVRTFTKSYGLPDWRVGYLVAARPILDQVAKVFEWEMLFGNYLSQKVAAIVLASGAPWLDGVREQFQRNRDALLGELRTQEKFSVVTPKGNPFAFINISSFGVPDDPASARLLSYGLPNTPGRAHGATGYLRVAFGGEPDAVRAASEALKKLYRDLETGRIR